MTDVKVLAEAEASDLPVAVLSASDSPMLEASLELAQGIFCGDLALAFNFKWARQIVDQFDIVPLPRAPGWVLGAVNVNGLIVPVVDLSSYFNSDLVPAQLLRGQRLLIGGIDAEDAENALALAFSQAPTQLEYTPRPAGDLSRFPQRLQEVCTGIATDAQARVFYEINTSQLMDALSAELSVV